MAKPMKAEGFVRAGIPSEKEGGNPKVGLLKEDEKKFFKLNEIALFIWDQCDGSHTIKDISKMLLNEVKKSSHPKAKTAKLKDIENDVKTIIERLKKFGLIKKD